MKDDDRLCCSSSSSDGKVGGSQPWHARIQTKQARCPQPRQSAKESRSDLLVGLRWQMWQGLSSAAGFIDLGMMVLVRKLSGEAGGVEYSGCPWKKCDCCSRGCCWCE